ncbi:hypothetical protein ScPMuIL_015837 [Solemya velum]
MDVPGPEPTNEKDGNIPDLAAAGSLHEYLVMLHKEYGPITSFWMGGSHVVSIASPELFKQHQHVFDRPPELFSLFEPFIGSKSIQYANGSDGRARRQNYDKAFTKEQIRGYYSTLKEISDQVIDKWSNMPTGEPIALNTSISSYALKVALVVFFGDHFHKEPELLSFNKAYDVCWSEMVKRLSDPSSLPDTDRLERFNKAMEELKQLIRSAVEHRRGEIATGDEHKAILIDMLLEHSPSEEQLISDSITYAVGGNGYLMIWAIYYLAQNPEVQQRAYQEIKSALRDDEGVDATNIQNLPYTMQVIDETMRCAVVAPYGARVVHGDSILGGYHIPKDTPVIHAYGAIHQDGEYWPDPEKFDPDRFSPAKVRERNKFVFTPFGFAGERRCPGYQLSYAEACVLFAPLLRKFEIKLAGSQSIKRIHGFVTHPSEEIWITLKQR